tara:strand:+ start:17210 stop:17722 length:513 start_codon:yes stop_codon:yes gene_type:complete
MIGDPNLNASKRHRELYNIFFNSPYFKKMVIKQEVSVRDLVPAYPTARHKTDWYIKDLGVIIEIMGEQHSKPVNFGGVHTHIVRTEFGNIKKRDNMKKHALIEEGYTYVELWYNEPLTEQYVISKIEKCVTQSKNNTTPQVENTKSFEEKANLDINKRQKALAKKFGRRK